MTITDSKTIDNHQHHQKQLIQHHNYQNNVVKEFPNNHNKT